jgi:hypothetical protein
LLYRLSYIGPYYFAVFFPGALYYRNGPALSSLYDIVQFLTAAQAKACDDPDRLPWSQKRF